MHIFNWLLYPQTTFRRQTCITFKIMLSFMIHLMNIRSRFLC